MSNYVPVSQDPAMIQQALSNGLTQMVMNQMMGQKAVSGTPAGPYLHGPWGQFSLPGIERPLISTHPSIIGLADQIPFVPNDSDTPFYMYITGFLAASGTEKTNVCDDAETAGAMKTCAQTAQFGRKEYQTREFEINRAGLINNRGEMMDLSLVNGPLVPQMAGLLNQRYGLSSAAAINGGREMLVRMAEVGIAFQRWLSQYLWIGNPTNNSAGGGYKEFPGLEILVGTTKYDAITGDACPSLYADVKDQNYSRVDDVNAANNIYNTISYLVKTRKHKAMLHNMGGVDWRFVMNEMLFWELTAVWPCNYDTYKCAFPNSVGSNGTINLNVDASAARDMVNAMREGRYLIVDGMRFPVIIDETLPFQSSSTTSKLAQGVYASDIYFLPFSVRDGSFRTLFWEHRNYANAMQAVMDASGASNPFFWSDGGRYLHTFKPPANWCIQVQTKIEPRVILLTPHLAGRITNVAYSPLQYADQPLPSQPYHVDGGNTSGYVPPSPYSDWNAPA